MISSHLVRDMTNCKLFSVVWPTNSLIWEQCGREGEASFKIQWLTEALYQTQYAKRQYFPQWGNLNLLCYPQFLSTFSEWHLKSFYFILSQTKVQWRERCNLDPTWINFSSVADFHTYSPWIMLLSNFYRQSNKS